MKTMVLRVITFIMLPVSIFGQDIKICSKINENVPIILCTSFAVFGSDTLYGMNFDFPDVEMKFSIISNNNRIIFHMSFNYGENFYVPVVGMNNEGLFANLQMLFPQHEEIKQPETNKIITLSLFSDALNNFENVDGVLDYIKDKRVVHGQMTLHNMFADPNGNAAIIEVGNEENLINKIEGKFIVMTNFSISAFTGKSYKDVEGSGAGRYKIAYENINLGINNFNVLKAFEILEKVKLNTKEFSTQCSMVFDPKESIVYFALKGDFTKVWKLDLATCILNTHIGFDIFKKAMLDDDGILASELLKK